MRNLLTRMIPKSIKESLKNKFLYKYTNYGALKSFSQFGEDIYVYKLFIPPKRDSANPIFLKKGFYVDIGANHPVINSQTYRLYKLGWRGINIDPILSSENVFNKVRPLDINVSVGVARNKGVITYYEYDLPVINSFNFEHSIETAKRLGAKLLNKRKVEVFPLKDILTKYKPKEIDIDFMSIDTEGYEMEILESNDFSMFRPKFILLEDEEIDIYNIKKSSIHNLLYSHSYRLNSIIGQNCLYEDMLNPKYNHKCYLGNSVENNQKVLNLNNKDAT